MRVLTISVTVAASLLISACAKPEAEIVYTSTPEVPAFPPKPRPRPSSYPQLIDMEDALAAFANQCAHRTSLQVAKDGIQCDFAEQIINRTYQFVGPIEDIREEDGGTVLLIRYQLRGSALEIPERGQGFQRIIYSDDVYNRRRSWTIVIKPDMTKTSMEELRELRRGTYVAVSGTIVNADGFQLVAGGNEHVQLINNNPLITAQASSNIRTTEIASDAKVIVLIDRSGSMAQDFHVVQLLSTRILQSLGPNNQFQILAFSDESLPTSYSSDFEFASKSNIDNAIDYLNSLVPEGKTHLNSAIEHALSMNPSILFVISDFDSFDEKVISRGVKDLLFEPHLHLIRISNDYLTPWRYPIEENATSVTILKVHDPSFPEITGIFPPALAAYLFRTMDEKARL